MTLLVTQVSMGGDAVFIAAYFLIGACVAVLVFGATHGR